MPGHDHLTVLIETNKAYVKWLNYISYSILISIVMCMVLFTMEFASFESKFTQSDWARLEKESSQRTPRLENENKNVT